MSVSITTLIVFTALGAFAGILAGFVVGTLNRLFFRNQFRGWVTHEMNSMQHTIEQGLTQAETQAQELVATAHIQTQQIYKDAAEHAAHANGKDIPKRYN